MTLNHHLEHYDLLKCRFYHKVAVWDCIKSQIDVQNNLENTSTGCTQTSAAEVKSEV